MGLLVRSLVIFLCSVMLAHSVKCHIKSSWCGFWHCHSYIPLYFFEINKWSKETLECIVTVDVHTWPYYHIYSDVGTEGTSGGLSVGEGLAIGLSVMLLITWATLIGVLLVYLRKHLHKGKLVICHHWALSVQLIIIFRVMHFKPNQVQLMPIKYLTQILAGI